MKNYIIPVSMKTDDVRAILDGRKSTFRKVIKQRPEYSMFCLNGRWYEVENEFNGPMPNIDLTTKQKKRHKPKFNTGDILLVKEKWFYDGLMGNTDGGEPDLESGNYSFRYIYYADNPNYPVDYENGSNGWNSSRAMPHEACRIFLKITEVKPERLQDITREGAIKEGIYQLPESDRPESLCWTYKRDLRDGYIKRNSFPEYIGPVNCFANMWDSIILKNRGYQPLHNDGWVVNPYVWVYNFQRISKEEALNSGLELK